MTSNRAQTSLPGLQGFMSFIPATARRILDLDLGSNRLPTDGLPTTEITSLETAARQTVGRPDALSPANVEEMDLGLIEGPFDCIVCQSLLPCLRDPVKMLEHVRRLLSPGGVLIACTFAKSFGPLCV
jgi:SAM-dependent methyltransferase